MQAAKKVNTFFFVYLLARLASAAVVAGGWGDGSGVWCRSSVTSCCVTCVGHVIVSSICGRRYIVLSHIRDTFSQGTSAFLQKEAVIKLKLLSKNEARQCGHVWLVVLSQVALHQMQKVCHKRQNKVTCSILSINVGVLEQYGHVNGCTKSAATSCCLVCIKSKCGYLRTTNCATAAS